MGRARVRAAARPCCRTAAPARTAAAWAPMTAGPAAAGPASAAARLTVSRRPLAPFGRRGRGHGGQVHRINGSTRNLMTDIALDVGQCDRILLATKTDGVAGGAG